MSNHTPGPWHVGEMNGHGIQIRSDYGMLAYTVRTLSPVQVAEANARLIAAAPDLLDAITVCLGHMTGGMDGDWRDCDPVELIRNVLAKVSP